MGNDSSLLCNNATKRSSNSWIDQYFRALRENKSKFELAVNPWTDSILQNSTTYKCTQNKSLLEVQNLLETLTFNSQRSQYSNTESKPSPSMSTSDEFNYSERQNSETIIESLTKSRSPIHQQDKDGILIILEISKLINKKLDDASEILCNTLRGFLNSMTCLLQELNYKYEHRRIIFVDLEVSINQIVQLIKELINFLTLEINLFYQFDNYSRKLVKLQSISNLILNKIFNDENFSFQINIAFKVLAQKGCKEFKNQLQNFQQNKLFNDIRVFEIDPNCVQNPALQISIDSLKGISFETSPLKKFDVLIDTFNKIRLETRKKPNILGNGLLNYVVVNAQVVTLPMDLMIIHYFNEYMPSNQGDVIQMMEESLRYISRMVFQS